MAASLEPREDDDAEKVTEVEGIGGRVEAAVDGEGSVGARLAQLILVGARVEEPALLEDVDDVGFGERRGGGHRRGRGGRVEARQPERGAARARGMPGGVARWRDANARVGEAVDANAAWRAAAGVLAEAARARRRRATRWQLMPCRSRERGGAWVRRLLQGVGSRRRLDDSTDKPGVRGLGRGPALDRRSARVSRYTHQGSNGRGGHLDDTTRRDGGCDARRAAKRRHVYKYHHFFRTLFSASLFVHRPLLKAPSTPLSTCPRSRLPRSR